MKTQNHSFFEPLEQRRMMSATLGTFSGTVFKDVNQDAIYDKGDTLVSGRTVFLNTSSSNTFVKGDKTAVTNSSGAFSFTGLSLGTYYVHDENPTGTSVIDPSATYYKATLTSTSPKATAVFGEVTLPFTHGVISGTLFSDASGSGTYKSSDAGVSGRTLYIDLTNKGTFVSGDPTAKTSSTGAFTFSNLKVGSYIVRDEVPSGRAVDDPSAGYATAVIAVATPKVSLLIGEKTVPTTSFVGQFELDTNGTIYDANLHQVGTIIGSYAGDIFNLSTGKDSTLTATESLSNELTGTIKGPSGTVAFTATLSSNVMTVTYTATKAQLKLVHVSPTPAPTPPVLTSYSGSGFSYVKPASWKVTQNTSGILMQSPDGTEQVGAMQFFADGIYTPATIAAAEVKAGVTIKFEDLLTNKSTSTTDYQAGIALITFMHNGVLYASAQEVETYTYFDKGTYNSSTKKYSGVTLTVIYEASAPQAQWVNYNSTLIRMMTSIVPNKSLLSPTGTAPAGSKPVSFSNLGFIDPGTTGGWSLEGLYNQYYNEYFDTEEANLLNAEALEQTEAINAQVNEFCNELLS